MWRALGTYNSHVTISSTTSSTYFSSSIGSLSVSASSDFSLVEVNEAIMQNHCVMQPPLVRNPDFVKLLHLVRQHNLQDFLVFWFFEFVISQSFIIKYQNLNSSSELIAYLIKRIKQKTSLVDVILVRAACVRCHGTKCPILAAFFLFFFFLLTNSLTFLPEGVIVGFWSFVKKSHKK